MQSLRLLVATAAAFLVACGTPPRPAAWAAPEVLVPPSSFSGVHGLAVDAKGRLLAGTVAGSKMWVVDRASGKAEVFIGAPEGEADDIAIGPKGEMAWTSFLQGVLRYRENDAATIRVLAKDLPGINSLAFDMRNGKLYASQVFLGDAMWEIDVAGTRPPRLIAKDMGGFNGFEVGTDGMIYGPLWFKSSVAKMDPASGAITVINSEFRIPAAANLDGKGNLWVVDTFTGELCRVDLASGRKTVVRKLNPALDNLAIAPDGTIYVSNMADNAVLAFNPTTDELRTLTSGKVAVPSGMKIEGGTLWVADIFAFREVDVASGAVRDIHRMQASDLEYPGAVGVSARQVLLSSSFTGSVQVLDRAGWKTAAMLHGFKAPIDAQFLPDGSIAVVEIETGTITRAYGTGFKERGTIASGLSGPVQMVLGKDGALYVTEIAGNLTRVDIATGAKSTVADKLALPKGLAQTPWGTFVVAESAARRLTEIDPATGARRGVAENLPIGLETGGPPPGFLTGVAVGDDGSVYVSADATMPSTAFGRSAERERSANHGSENEHDHRSEPAAYVRGDNWVSPVQRLAYFNSMRLLNPATSFRGFRGAFHGFGYSTPLRDIPQALHALNAPIAYFDRRGVMQDVYTGEPTDEVMFWHSNEVFLGRGVRAGTQGEQMQEFMRDFVRFFTAQLKS